MDPFRDESETLRAQLAKKEAELDLAKRKIAALEADLHPPPSSPRVAPSAGSPRNAYAATALFAAFAAGWMAAQHFGLARFSTGLLVVGGATGIASLVLGTLRVHHACDTPFSYTLFVTVFWVPFCAVPIVGAVIAVTRVVILARGKFGAATITTNGDSRSYDAIDIGRAGLPLALFFLVVAVIHALLWRLAYA